ncbi:thiamine pyrophosphate-dependent dehydrogenase E1 component subunit alpha [Chloroflexota bacterium]
MEEIESAKLIEIYTIMVRMRTFEEGVAKEYRKGNIPGFVLPSIGQEAISAGVCALLREDDYVFSTHRCLGDVIARGARFDKAMAEILGKETGYNKGKAGVKHLAAIDLNCFGATGVVGDFIPVACGAALGCKMQKRDTVVVSFFGDGATCTGAFHEAVGHAAIWDLPVILVCANNQFCASTPVKDYTKLKDLSDRAKAYGIPGVTVDGMDALAVAKVARKAIERARDGRGPTLIVGETYHFLGFNLSEDGWSYRTKEEVEKWKKRDAIERLRGQLLQEKILTESEINEIHTATIREVDEAVRFAIESPEPRIEVALEDIRYTAG